MKLNKVIDVKTGLGLILILVMLFWFKSAISCDDNIIVDRFNWVNNVCVGDPKCIAENYQDDAVIVIDRTNGRYHQRFNNNQTFETRE